MTTAVREPAGSGGTGSTGDDADGDARGRRPSRPRALVGAVAGFVAAGVALGVVALAGRLVGGARPLDVSVGDVVIRNAPNRVVHWAIDVFGTNDKPALRVGIVAVALAAGALAGVLAARWRLVGPVVFALAALGGVAAADRDRQSELGPAAFVAALGALAGAWALHALLARAAPRPAASGVAVDRRGFLRLATGLAAGALVAVGLSRVRRGPSVAEQAIAELELPTTPPIEGDLAPLPPSLPVDGITPLVTPNADFYRIDTALSLPDIDPAGWSLAVGGMVDAPSSLSFDELLALPAIEQWITLACVSNTVGGGLVGNAAWRGVPLAALLDRAGVDPAATQVVGRSIDGFTVGFPTAAALDGRAAMVAYQMNGEPLPRAHGFPARLVVPGLYGYVSATKWLTEIELTTWDAFDAYWVPRGWAKEGPVKTQSRIDVPRGRIDPGPRAIAGVAWAPTRGISGVEVQIDDGPWQRAELADELHADTWRQWRLPWDPEPGRYVLRVRATDGTGETQVEEQSAAPPDGATGWHTITVHVG